MVSVSQAVEQSNYISKKIWIITSIVKKIVCLFDRIGIVLHIVALFLSLFNKLITGYKSSFNFKQEEHNNTIKIVHCVTCINVMDILVIFKLEKRYLLKESALMPLLQVLVCHWYQGNHAHRPFLFCTCSSQILQTILIHQTLGAIADIIVKES